MPRPVFGCDVMRGQVPVEAAIGDSFPATALSLLSRKGANEVGSQADGQREGKVREDMEMREKPVRRQACNPGL